MAIGNPAKVAPLSTQTNSKKYRIVKCPPPVELCKKIGQNIWTGGLGSLHRFEVYDSETTTVDQWPVVIMELVITGENQVTLRGFTYPATSSKRSSFVAEIDYGRRTKGTISLIEEV